MNVQALILKYKKILIIIIGIISGPLFLILIPYLTSINEYAEFNSFYYKLQLISLFSMLGFEITAARKKLSLLHISISMFVSNLIFILLFITTIEYFNFYIIFLILYFNSVSSVMSAYYLYIENIKAYLLLSIIRVAILLVILPFLLKIIEISMLNAYFLSIACIFLFTLIIVRTNILPSVKQINYYSIITDSFFIFLINASSTLPFLLDKIYVTNSLDKIQSNTYIFVWTLSVPIFYLGNVIEKYLISESVITIKKIITSFLVVLFFGCSYFFIVSFFLYYFIPKHIYLEDAISFFKLDVVILTTFAMFHYPIASLVNKNATTNQLKILSFLSLGILIIFMSIYFVLYFNNYIFDIKFLYIFLALYLLLNILLKILFLIKTKLYQGSII